MMLCFILLFFELCKAQETLVNEYQTTCFRPRDCGEILQHRPGSKTGVYQIYPGNVHTLGVYTQCNMERSCGGWTVIQRRMDGSVDFKREWYDYRYGFGNPGGEYWIGNDIIHDLTKNDEYELLVLMEDFEKTSRYAHYSSFRIDGVENKYKLNVTGYTGNAGDSFSVQNGQFFSTIDQDNDNSDSNCAATYEGAWWYNDCHESNLNGRYLRGKTNSYANGINWKIWKEFYYSLKKSEMMVRRVS